MEKFEQDVINEEFNELKTKEDRQRLKNAKFKENLESAGILQLAKEKLQQKEEIEKERSSQVQFVEQLDGSERDQFIQSEIRSLKKEFGSEFVKSFIADVLTVEVIATKWRTTSIKIQFPNKYPEEELILEFISKTLSPDLILKLRSAATGESKKRIGGRQLIDVVAFVKTFLENNLLLVAFDDLQEIRRLFEGGEPEMKSVQERSGIVHVLLKEGDYFMDDSKQIFSSRVIFVINYSTRHSVGNVIFCCFEYIRRIVYMVVFEVSLICQLGFVGEQKL
eukprot:TRINITY_DN6085_c0_g1_i16.p1 TRINITY_DN6085_c0_g1~~TRINITY_DN6085_c0_g1_i16.p1  ORF type:complete len:287 (-),score=31.15 TRINITY_DN6085_c0_g1_i16:329-1165(-)